MIIKPPIKYETPDFVKNFDDIFIWGKYEIRDPDGKTKQIKEFEEKYTYEEACQAGLRKHPLKEFTEEVIKLN